MRTFFAVFVALLIVRVLSPFLDGLTRMGAVRLLNYISQRQADRAVAERCS